MIIGATTETMAKTAKFDFFHDERGKEFMASPFKSERTALKLKWLAKSPVQ